MTDKPDPTRVLRLDITTAELVADVLTEAADQRTRAARKGAGALQAEAAVAAGRFDKRPAAVKITDLLAEANLLDMVAQAARTTDTAPAAADRPPAKARRARKAGGKAAGQPGPDGRRDPDAGPTEADAAIALAAIEEFNATVPPLPDPDGIDGDLDAGDKADLDPAETGAAAEDLDDPDLNDDELDVIGLSDPDDDSDLDVDDNADEHDYDDELGTAADDEVGA